MQDYVLAYRGERAPDDVAKRIAGHCDGNPLLLHVICEGRVQRKVDVSKWLDPPLPRNVPEAFREKWDHLDGDVQDILALAAAVGQEFHGELVASCARDLRSLLCAEDPEGALTGAEQQAFVRREPGPDADVYHFFERACYEIALSESRRADLAQDVTPILVEHAIAIRERHRVEWVDEAVFLSALVMDQRASALRTTLAAHVRTNPVASEQLFEAALSAQLLAALCEGIDPHGEWEAMRNYQQFVGRHDELTTGPLMWHKPTGGHWAFYWHGFSRIVRGTLVRWLMSHVDGVDAARVTQPLLRSLTAVSVRETQLEAQRLLFAEKAVAAAENETQRRSAQNAQAKALTEAGLHEQAIAICEELVESARADRVAGRAFDEVGEALHNLATALTEAGIHERAISIREELVELGLLHRPRWWLADALESGGFYERAIEVHEEIVEWATESERRAALGDLAEALTRYGDHERAISIEEELAESGPWGEHESPRLAEALTRAGDHERAISIRENRVESASDLRREGGARWGMGELAEALTEAGLHERAISIRLRLLESTREHKRREALVILAKTLTKAGLHDRAVSVREELVESEPEQGRRERLKDLAGALTEAGAHERAIAILDKLVDSVPEHDRGKMLQSLAFALTRAGLHERAIALHQELVESAPQHQRHEALTWLASALTAAGLHQRAVSIREELVESEPDHRRWEALAWLARALTEAGRHERAIAICEELVEFGPQHERSEWLAWLARALAEAGLQERALSILKEESRSPLGRLVLRLLAGEMTESGLHEEVVAIREVLLESVPERERREALRELARTLTEAGHHERATVIREELLESISEPIRRGALGDLAWTLTKAGNHERAIALREEMVESATESERREALMSLAVTLGEAGFRERALSVREEAVEAAPGLPASRGA